MAALTAGDIVRSREIFDLLREAAGTYVAGEDDSLSSVWNPFLGLVGRRGYFVRDPDQVRESIQEIRQMGPGFDLYDLAAALARCDTALATHLQTPLSRIFPELRAFAPEPGANDMPPLA